MYKYKSAFSLADMVESSPERQEQYVEESTNNTMPTPDSAGENLPPVNKIRGKPAGADIKKASTAKARQPIVSAAAASTKVAGAGVRKGAAAQKKAATTVVPMIDLKKRSILQEQINYRHASDGDEPDDLGLVDELEDRSKEHGMDEAEEINAPIMAAVETTGNTKKRQTQPKKEASKRRARQPKTLSTTDPVKKVKGTASGKLRVMQEALDLNQEEDHLYDILHPKFRAKKARKAALKPKAGNAAISKAAPTSDMVIAETQASPKTFDDSMIASVRQEEEEAEGDDEGEGQDEQLMPPPSPRGIATPPGKTQKKKQPVAQAMRPPSRAPSESRAVGANTANGVKRRRVADPVTTSDVERGMLGGAGDDSSAPAALRRKLGDATRRHEHLENQHRQLREVGIKEAELNFERLKKQSEEKNNAATKLIASLRTELATQTALAGETRSLQGLLSTRTDELERLKGDVERLTSSLSAVEAENKSLAAKLAAARNAQQQASADNNTTNNVRRMPGSAVKTASNGRGIGVSGGAGAGASAGVAAANAEVNRVTQLAQLKENLYSDLTGLILTNVKKVDDADVFDCIQTGRNGTLHFKLTLSTPPSNTTTHTNANYDDIEFLFTPLLDEQRDRDLIELLPDYLTEEITFARENAEKFYARVVEALTKNPHSGR